MMVVPPMLYAVSGIPLSIHFNDVLLEGPTGGESLEVECLVGDTDEDGAWSFTASEERVGDHLLTLRWKNTVGEVLEEASTVIRVSSSQSGADRELTLLLVGDSLTNMTLYPNELARLLSQPGNPTWKMLGLNNPEKAEPGVAHEGYGGWTWASFNTRFFPDKPPGDKLGSSPFLFPDQSTGKPVLDIGRYLDERGGGLKPDLAIFFLGINDCCHFNSNDLSVMDTQIDGMVAQAEVLLGAFRKVLPEVEIGICLTPTPNVREAAFQANYKGAFSREGWRRIQYRLVERQLAQFGNREDRKISIIPLSLVVDSESDYPSGDAVHPNAKGCQAIGTQIFAWMKNWLAVSDRNGRPRTTSSYWRRSLSSRWCRNPSRKHYFLYRRPCLSAGE